MKTSDFYYELPQELIAQDPLEDRSASRLMPLRKLSSTIQHPNTVRNKTNTGVVIKNNFQDNLIPHPPGLQSHTTRR